MNIIVCDDEKEILENINNYLSDTTYNILTYDSYEKLEKAIKKELFNILILDIKLGNKSGIEFISKYQELLKNTKVIYITGYDEFIEDTFETNPTYLLRKPLNKEKMNKAISKAIKELENEEKFIFVKHLNETIKLKQKDILYIESDGRKVNIYLESKKISTYAKLSSLEEELSHEFLRVHKSFIINLRHVSVYKVNKILLDNEKEIAISRTYQQKVKSIVVKFLKGE